MDMALKEFRNNFWLVIIITLFFIQCKRTNSSINEIGLNFKNYEVSKEFYDDAGVCSMKEYKLLLRDQDTLLGKNSMFIKRIRENHNWKSEDWSNKIDENILSFVYDNFKHTNLKSNIENSKKSYYLYGYQGKKEDLFAIKLFVFIPDYELLYYIEIIP